MYDASGMKDTPESWAAEQARGGAAYLFRGSSAHDGGQDMSPGGRNPWMKDSRDDVNTFHRLKATASEASYAATRWLDAPRPAPSPFNHGNARYLMTFAA
jgi:hypothetical protein